MTVVAIWHEKSDSSVWSVADTRISTSFDSGGVIIRTDVAAKLFALPIVCHSLSPLPRIQYAQTVGFAFAGDVPPAAMTYATASTFLQNLTTTHFAFPPALREVAEHVRTIADRFCGDWLNSTNGKYGKFEAAIFGLCPRLGKFVAYHLAPSVAPAFAITLAEHHLQHETDVLILGDRKRLNHEIDRIRRDGDPFDRKGRVPKLAIEAIVQQDDGNAGGSLSVGLASGMNYILHSWIRPKEHGKPECALSFNGFDLADLGDVGDFRIGIRAIA